MLREILSRVALCVAWSIAVTVAYHRGWPVAIPSTLHVLVGTALGLLLVFRTNASYDRFWEGRKLWGGMVNECRNLIRGAEGWFGHDRALLTNLALWTAAFPFASCNYLRGTPSNLAQPLPALPAAPLQAVEAAEHPVLAVAAQMTECLSIASQRGYLSDIARANLDQNIHLLVGYLGACERIRKTPLPFAYIVHLRRALVLYCFTLPFALVQTFGWGTILDVLFVSYIFFGIEEIGVEIEGPFGFDDNDLPLEQISETIRHNVFQLAGLPREGPPDAMSGAL